MNTTVSFELAKFLKEKEFEQKTKSYNEDGKLVTVSLTIRRFNPEKIYYPAPTIAEVVMWLYEKNGIWISIIQNEYEDKFQYTLTQRKLHLWYVVDNGILFNSPTEAYEAAIKYTLNNLI